MTWTHRDVENRILEAAYVEACLPRDYLGPSGIKGSSLNQRTMRDIGDANAQESLRDKSKWSWGSSKPVMPADAIKRYEETVSLLAKYLPLINSRARAKPIYACLWAWAFSVVGKRSFRSWCRKAGMPPRTATRYKDRALSILLEAYQTELSSADKKCLPEVRQISDILRNKSVSSETAPSENHIILERPQRADYADPLVIEQVEKAISRANRRARRMKKRRLKKKGK